MKKPAAQLYLLFIYLLFTVFFLLFISPSSIYAITCSGNNVCGGSYTCCPTNQLTYDLGGNITGCNSGQARSDPCNPTGDLCSATCISSETQISGQCTCTAPILKDNGVACSASSECTSGQCCGVCIASAECSSDGSRTCSSASLGDCGSQTNPCVGGCYTGWTGTCSNFPQEKGCSNEYCSYHPIACGTTPSNTCEVDNECCLTTAPNPPSLLFPSDGNLNVNLPVVLQWNNPDIWGYRCRGTQVNTVTVEGCQGSGCANWVSIVNNSPSSTTSVTWDVPAKNYNTVYRWRAKANNGALDSAYTTPFTFTLESTVPACSSFGISSPASAKVKNGGSMTMGITFSDSSGISLIQGIVSGANNDSFTNGVLLCSNPVSPAVSPKSTTCSWSTVSTTEGYHKVWFNAADALGNVNSANAACSGTLCVDDTAPTPPTPTIGACNSSGNVTISWSAVTDNGCAGMDVTPYWIDVDDNSSFSSPEGSGWLSNTSTSATFAVFPGSTVYARIRVKDSLGNVSAYQTASNTSICPEPPYCYSAGFSNTVKPGRGATLNMSFSGGTPNYVCNINGAWSVGNSTPNTPVSPATTASSSPCSQVFSSTPYSPDYVSYGSAGGQVTLDGLSVTDSNLDNSVCPHPVPLNIAGYDVTVTSSPQSVAVGGYAVYSVGLTSNDASIWAGQTLTVTPDSGCPPGSTCTVCSSGTSDASCNGSSVQITWGQTAKFKIDTDPTTPKTSYTVNVKVKDDGSTYEKIGSAIIVSGDLPCSITGTTPVYPGGTSTLTETHTYPTNNWTNSCGAFLNGGNLYSTFSGNPATWVGKNTAGGLLSGAPTCTSTDAVVDSTGGTGSCSYDIAVRDFNLTVSPVSRSSVCIGNSTTYTVTGGTVNSWDKSVTLSVNCPTGATCTFSPTTLFSGAGTTSTLTVQNVPTGTSSLVVTGTVNSAGDVSNGYNQSASAVTLGSTACPFTCTAVANPVSVYTGGTSTIYITPVPALPPSGYAGGYGYSWPSPVDGRTNPSCGRWLNNINPGSALTATWEARNSGGSLLGTGSSCDSTAQLTDPGSLATANCTWATVTDPYDFTLNILPNNPNVTKGNTQIFTITVSSVNPSYVWTKPLTLSITNCPGDLTNCQLDKTIINPTIPGDTVQLSVGTNSTTTLVAHAVSLRGEVGVGDPSSGFGHNYTVPFTVVLGSVGCFLSPASVVVYPGESQKFYPTPTPLVPPSGSTSYSYDCTAVAPSSGTSSNKTDINGNYYCEWIKPFVTPYIPALGYTVTEQITDPGSRANSTCSSTIDQPDFTFGTANNNFVVKPGDSQTLTFSSTTLNGWGRAISVDTTYDPSNPDSTTNTCNTLQFLNAGIACSTVSGSGGIPPSNSSMTVSTQTDTPTGTYTFWVHAFDNQSSLSPKWNHAVPITFTVFNCNITPKNVTIPAGGTQTFSNVYDSTYTYNWNDQACGYASPSCGRYTTTPAGNFATVLAPAPVDPLSGCTIWNKVTDSKSNSACCSAPYNVAAVPTTAPTSTPTPTPTGCQTPPPSGLDFDPITATNSATVKWVSAGSSPAVSGYQVQWKDVNGGNYTGTWQNPDVPPDGLSKTITGLSCGTTYKWQVRSTGTCGISAPVDGPQFTTAVCFTCQLTAGSLSVPSGGTTGVTIGATDPNFTVADWYPSGYPSCGSFQSFGPDPNKATWWANNGAGSNVPAGAVCNVGAIAHNTTTGENVVCNPVAISVAASLFCCGQAPYNSTCHAVGAVECNGTGVSDRCAGYTTEGGWCGVGGPSYNLFCNGITPTPNPCQGAPGTSCQFTTVGGNTSSLPYTYRFGVRPNTNPTAYFYKDGSWHQTSTYPDGDYTWNLVDGSGWKTLGDTYNSNMFLTSPASFTVQTPSNNSFFVDKIDTYIQADPVLHLGGKVYGALYESENNYPTKIIAEADSLVPDKALSGNPHYEPYYSVLFDFSVEPKIDPNKTYYFLVRSIAPVGRNIQWGTKAGKAAMNVYLRPVTGTLLNPSTGWSTYTTDYLTSCINQTSCQSPAYTLTSDPTVVITSEVSATNDTKYYCDGGMNCWTGRFTSSGCFNKAVLGTSIQPPWFQAANGGDVYGKSGITSHVPASEFLFDKTKEAGIARSGDLPALINTDGRPICENKDWKMQKDMNTSWNYSYFSTKLANKITNTLTGDQSWNGDIGITGGVLEGSSKVITITGGNLTLGSTGVVRYKNNGTAIVLVDKDLYIHQNVRVDETGTTNSALVFIVNGDIIIDPSVNKVDGIYFAQKTINDGVGVDQLLVHGGFYVSSDSLSNILFQRSYSVGPSEQVTFEPKYLLKLMDYLGDTNYVWQEVPG